MLPPKVLESFNRALAEVQQAIETDRVQTISLRAICKDGQTLNLLAFTNDMLVGEGILDFLTLRELDDEAMTNFNAKLEEMKCTQ